MSIVLQGRENFALVYLDDIFIFPDTMDVYLKRKDSVLSGLRKCNLRLKPCKYEILKKETQYLGFRVSEKGIQPDFDKITVIKAVSTPVTHHQAGESFHWNGLVLSTIYKNLFFYIVGWLGFMVYQLLKVI